MNGFVVLKLNKVEQVLGVQAVFFDKAEADKLARAKNQAGVELYKVMEGPIVGLPGTKVAPKDVAEVATEEKPAEGEYKDAATASKKRVSTSE